MDIVIFDDFIMNVRRERGVTMFHGLYFQDIPVIKEWTELVDFVEHFQAYTRNFLTFENTYRNGPQLQFRLAKKANQVLLTMEYMDIVFEFSKLDALKVVHKINRVLTRCDLFHQG